MKTLLREAAERSIAYLNGLEHRRVAPDSEALARLQDLDGDLPDEPTDTMEVLSMLDEIGSPATMATAGPRFFGFVVGGSLPAPVAASWLAGAWDQNAGLATLSPVSAALEEICLRWLRDILQLPPSCAAAFVTGATMANVTGLAAARHAMLKRAGWDVESDGLFGAPEVRIVIGDEAHPSVTKALSLLGFGANRVERVPTDRQGRMDARALPALDDRTVVCIQAGNVNTGASDPAMEICTAAAEAGAWLHVDGAFGLWAAASPSLRHLMAGVERADSWATDAHKWLNVPYDSGLAFVRDPADLQAAMAVTAAYLPFGEQREPSHYTPELSRRARGVEIWAALRSLGRNGLAELIERTCRHANRFAMGLRAAGYEVLNDVVLNQVLVSFGDDEATRRVIAGLQADGTCWCGGTEWHGRSAMRISVSSWATTEQDVKRSLDAMLRIAREET